MAFRLISNLTIFALASLPVVTASAVPTESVRRTAGYITSPQCSPSRAGLITGHDQARFGFKEISLCPLPSEEITVAERLRPAGYRTRFIGKWHLDVNILCGRWLLKNLPTVQRAGRGFIVPPGVNAPFTPQAQGLDDYYDGELKQCHTNFTLDDFALAEPKTVQDDRFHVDVQSDAAVTFIDKNHAEPKQSSGAGGNGSSVCAAVRPHPRNSGASRQYFDR